jgi:hypothetical protein
MADTPTTSPTAGTTVPNVGTAPPQASQLPADRPQVKPLPTKDYKLKVGARHFHNGQLVEPGATVPLTDSQYRAFADKFEPADKQVDKEAPPPAPQTPIASTSGFAQDHGAKTGPLAGGGSGSGGAPPPPASDQTTDKGGGVTPATAVGGQVAASPPPASSTPPAGAPKTTP